MSDCLSRLQPGHIVMFGGERCRVIMVNDCRAQIVPIEKRHTEVKQIIDGKETVVAKFNKTGAAVNISPNSFIDIVGYEKPTTITAVQSDLPGHHNGGSVPERGERRSKKSSR